MEGNEHREAMAYFEEYAATLNNMAKEVFNRAQQRPSSNLGEVFNPEKVVDLLSKDIRVDAAKLVDQQMALMTKQLELGQRVARAMLGENVEPVITEERGDGRFRDSEWSDNVVFSYIKQAYLLNAQMLQNMVSSLEFKDKKTAKQAGFYTRQFINSVAPTNYVLTNPEVCREVTETEGKCLQQGLANFMADLENSPADAFRISQTDMDAFSLGENLANTPGKVIFQNDLMQLIQYKASTKQVFSRPVVITPPFINKYYVLDLEEKKSLVRWLVAQGYTVFMISWVNPDEQLADKDFGDYMKEGPIEALNVARKITGADKVNMVGFCVGGTLLATAQAYLKAKGDDSVASLTFLTTLLDFAEPGELGIYFSEEMLASLEQSLEQKGIMDGRILNFSFSLLRENSLFWSYFVNNYLKGKKPPAFDILYWNSDPTHIPANTFRQYVRNSYWDNTFKKPGGVVIDGVPIDFGKIDTPAYFLATQADHIVLWQSSYQGVKLLSGPKRFVLAGSGHLAGVINPVEGGKYPHWCNDDWCNDDLPNTAEDWLRGAKQCEGSWWPDWQEWLSPFSGDKVTARKVGVKKQYPALEDAPGSYVKVRI